MKQAINAFARELEQPLIRRDLLEFEELLLADISTALEFSAHSLYFPADEGPLEPVWLPEEDRLLLPLRQSPDKSALGVLLLRGLDAAKVPAFLELAPHLVRLSLEKTALLKAQRQDEITGLLNGHTFVRALEQGVERVRQNFAPRTSAALDQERAWHGSFGLILFHQPGFRAFAEEHGHERREQLLAAQARAMVETMPSLLPPDALAAHLGQGRMAVLAAAPLRRLQEAALALCQCLDEQSVPGLLPDAQLHLHAFAGYAVFPQDMEGFGRRSAREQALTLLARAENASWRAAVSHEKILSFGGVLQQGGHVSECVSPGRVYVDLGRMAGARPGQSFSVWRGTSYKGEVLLLEAGRERSLAEERFLADPGRPLEAGDTLRLAPEEEQAASAQAAEPEGLLRHGEFMASFRAYSGRKFLLALLRLEPAEPDPILADQLLARLMPALRQEWQSRLGQEEVLAGRMGLYGIMALHSGLGEDSLPLYQALGAALREQGFDLAVGLAVSPFLDYRPADMPECCRKALEYALLLPEPHVGLCDSLALNISADKLYSQGDAFGAVEEYGKALLADEANVLARNSLGVCLAGLGRLNEARRHFEKALALCPGDAPSHYNLGALCLQHGEAEAADTHFRACLAQDPRHLYALVRLGQMAEQQNKAAQAHEYYRKGMEQNPGVSLPCRLLARLELRQGRRDQAREFLHQALARNPRDAVALQMLAKLYLDGGEDPELAEALARRSVALEPDRRASWQELARAMTVGGKDTAEIQRKLAAL